MLLAENPRQGMTTEARVVIRILLISDHVNRQDNTQIQTIMRIIYICFLQKINITDKTKDTRPLLQQAC
ncbi:hypothetical protein [Escherichia sp. KCJ4928]|uniref:hypothetical protein n=1 Tax=Escherichia sp. KCJ4928 TaxID=2545464 RepID=UPI00104CDB5B|nr:hypothetical protein E0D98_20660 [Escherichia sp. KCJ4928]